MTMTTITNTVSHSVLVLSHGNALTVFSQSRFTCPNVSEICNFCLQSLVIFFVESPPERVLNKRRSEIALGHDTQLIVSINDGVSFMNLSLGPLLFISEQDTSFRNALALLS
jgi:hypothetical protein